MIDDEEGTLLLTKNILVNEGYDVKAFSDPQEACIFIDDNSVDLLIIDIMMPTMNGVEMVKNLSQNQSDLNLKVIFLTGILSSSLPESEGITVDGQKYSVISKPIEPQLLMSTVEKIISE